VAEADGAGACKAEDDLRLHQLPARPTHRLAQEVIRLAGEHARNDIGTVMLWTSAIVVLLSSGVD
jgi:hypothetical protein